ncbi:MAG: G5 domain-containing protein, partial [Clostridia bacterium]|nr:G5 domain-containing protein [Clostridia bacterium]
MNKKPQRIRHLPGKGKKFKLKNGGKAALATGALTLSILLASCGEVSGDGTESGTGSTGRPAGSTRPSDVTTVAPLENGTHTSVFYEEIPFETVYIESPELYDDEEIVQEEGAAGKAEVREHTLYKDGKVQDVWQETLTLAEAKNRVILRGTKPSVEIKENTITETLEKYSTIYEECDTMEVG